jgi:hypothetical protein
VQNHSSSSHSAFYLEKKNSHLNSITYLCNFNFIANVHTGHVGFITTLSFNIYGAVLSNDMPIRMFEVEYDQRSKNKFEQPETHMGAEWLVGLACNKNWEPRAGRMATAGPARQKQKTAANEPGKKN